MSLSATEWRAKINGEGPRERVPPGAGVGGLQLCILLDVTRNLYNKLLALFDSAAEELGALSHEASELWSEVRMMRAYTAEMEKKVGASQARVNELERYRAQTQGLVTPKTGYSFRSYDNVQCRAVPEYALADMDKRISDLNKQLADKNSLVEDMRANENYRAAEKTRLISELQQKITDKSKGFQGGVELALENKVDGSGMVAKVYELEGFATRRRTGAVLALRDVPVPAHTLAQIGALRHELHNLRLSSKAEIDKLLKSNQSLAHPLPVTYGVDVSAVTGDVTVVTVKQGGKLLFSIDVKQENAKRRWPQHIDWKPFVLPAVRFCGPKVQPQNIPRTDYVATASDSDKPRFDITRYTPARKAFHQEHIADIAKWQRGRAQIARHGRKWLPWEDRTLSSRYLSGWSLKELADWHCREWEAILCRLQRLAGKKVESAVTSDALALMWIYFFTLKGNALPERIRKIALNKEA